MHRLAGFMPHLTVIMLIRLPPWQKFSRLYFEKFITNNCHSNFEICRLNFPRLTVTIISVNRKIPYLWLVAGLLCFLVVSSSFAQGTAFQYQGQLSNGSSPANGNYDFQFTLYNAVTNGSPLSGTETNFDVGVTNGLFITTLDFGQSVFNGQSVWLNIGVRTNGSTPFTLLSPLQPVLPVPYAIFANSASNLVGTLSGSAFTGFTNAVSLTNGANLFSGSFSGNGGSVTNVNVTNLTGVLADSQLPNNTAYLNSNQLFTANNTFNGTNTFNGVNTFTNLYGNSFSGSFFGNGLVGWIVVTGNTVQASIDHGYLLTNAQNVTVTLPTLINAGDIVRIAGAGFSGWSLAQNAGQSVLGNFVTYGKNWIQTDPNDVNWKSIACSPDGTKLAAAYSGAGGFGAAISQNSGQSWVVTSPGSFTWQAIAISDDGTKLVIAPLSNVIWNSTNSGSSWTANPSSGSLNWTGVTATDNGANFVAVASGSGIYTNSGITWVQSYSSGGNTWSGINRAAGGSELVAANKGVGIFVSTNSGAKWVQVNSQTLGWSCVAASASGNRMIAGVNVGGLYISTNSGTSFVLVSGVPSSAAWTGVGSSADGSKLEAVAAGGSIYSSANWGVTWQTNAGVGTWSAVASSSDGSVACAVINTNLTVGNYGIFTSQASLQSSSTAGTNGYISGAQNSSVELQCIGNNQFMPVSFTGTIWAN